MGPSDSRPGCKGPNMPQRCAFPILLRYYKIWCDFRKEWNDERTNILLGEPRATVILLQSTFSTLSSFPSPGDTQKHGKNFPAVTLQVHDPVQRPYWGLTSFSYRKYGGKGKKWTTWNWDPWPPDTLKKTQSHIPVTITSTRLDPNTKFRWNCLGSGNKNRNRICFRLALPLQVDKVLTE